MQVFSNFDSGSFRFQGVRYMRNFIPLKVGDYHVTIYNAYDSRMQLMESTHFSQISINGHVYPTQLALMEQLSKLLFVKQIADFSQIVDPDGFITLGELTKNDDSIIVDIGYHWRIFEEVYGNTSPSQFDINLEEDGWNRKDIIVANQSNTFELIQGTPSLGSNTAIQPQTPIGKLLLTVVDVYGDDVSGGDTLPPINTALFVEKEERKTRLLNSSGVIGIVGINDKASRLIVTGGVTSVSGISKIYSNTKHDGQPFIVENRQNIPLKLKHQDSTGSGTNWWFGNGKDLYLLAGEIATFIWDVPNNLLRYAGETQKSTLQITITGNTSLDSTYNNAIVKVKANAIIIIPSTLMDNFSCVFRTFAGSTATFTPNSVTMDAPKGLSLTEHKMATLFKDGAVNTFILEGELSV